MLKEEWKKYFDGEFNPDPVYGTDSRLLQAEKEMTALLREKCRAVFPSEEAYEAFEDDLFAFIGRMQVIASEAGFEKGILCGKISAKEE